MQCACACVCVWQCVSERQCVCVWVCVTVCEWDRQCVCVCDSMWAREIVRVCERECVTVCDSVSERECVCVTLWVRERVCVCVRVCARVRVCASVWERVCECDNVCECVTVRVCEREREQERVCVYVCVWECTVRVSCSSTSSKERCNFHVLTQVAAVCLQLDYLKDKRVPSEKKDGGKENFEWNKGWKKWIDMRKNPCWAKMIVFLWWIYENLRHLWCYVMSTVNEFLTFRRSILPP